LALPLVVGGFRSAALQVMSTATVAAYIGLGGLGRFLIDGQAYRDYPQMVGGSVLVIALALAVDGLFVVAQRFAGNKETP
jgi:osmoprotectant transport system permease protein